jgi:hypothetical protein
LKSLKLGDVVFKDIFSMLLVFLWGNNILTQIQQILGWVV